MSEIDMQQVCTWAREGGDIARHYFNTVKGQRKGDHSLVTQADVEIEEMLRARIHEHHPTHGIAGEEYGIENADREFVWCLDPIDGTESFLYGLAVWGISIGIWRYKEPYLGVVYLPATDECYWNDLQGSYWNGTPIHVSDLTSLDKQNWIIGHSRSHLNYDISFPGKIRSFGCFAAHYCYVARGSAPAALMSHPALWDAAAGMAILHTAGGVSTTLPNGDPFDPRVMFDSIKCPVPLLASPPALVNDLVQYIKER